MLILIVLACIVIFISSRIVLLMFLVLALVQAMRKVMPHARPFSYYM